MCIYELARENVCTVLDQRTWKRFSSRQIAAVVHNDVSESGERIVEIWFTLLALFSVANTVYIEKNPFFVAWTILQTECQCAPGKIPTSVMSPHSQLMLAFEASEFTSLLRSFLHAQQGIHWQTFCTVTVAFLTNFRQAAALMKGFCFHHFAPSETRCGWYDSVSPVKQDRESHKLFKPQLLLCTSFGTRVSNFEMLFSTLVSGVIDEMLRIGLETHDQDMVAKAFLVARRVCMEKRRVFFSYKEWFNVSC